MNKDLKKLIDDSLNEFIKTDLPVGGEEKYNKQEPGGTMMAVNLDEIRELNNCIDESSFQIYNKTLCPVLWDENQHLDPKVRINLLRIAYDFYEKTDFKAPIIDISLMGSIANYNWTIDSDADIHILIDYTKLQIPSETVSNVVKDASSQWNNQHHISVKGHKVEINFQNSSDAKPHVTGIYSLIKDQWVRKPVLENPNINKPLIQSIYDRMKNYVDICIQGGDTEKMKECKKYLDAFRQYGLDTRGELSTENIVFKILRSKGYIKNLKDAITKVYDASMTVVEGINIDYLGSTYGGDVKAIPVDNAQTKMHGDYGMISGINGNNWRYLAGRKSVLWNTKPSDEDKLKVDDFLYKRGITDYTHKNMYSYAESSEVKEGFGMGDPSKDPKAVGRWTVKYDSDSKILKESDIQLQGKSAMMNDKTLRSLSVEDVKNNIVFIRQDTGGFFQDGFSLVYFMDSEESAKDMESGKIPYLMVPRGTFHSGGNPITDIWKKKFQKPGTEHILGVLEGISNPEHIFIDMITVRSGWQRNHIAKLMLDIIKKEFPNAKMSTSSTTDKGEKLFKSYNSSDVKEGFDPSSWGPNACSDPNFYQTQIDSMRQMEDVDEVSLKNVKSRFPSPDALHKNSRTGKPTNGNWDFSKLSMDNLKSMRDKEARMMKFYSKYEDKTAALYSLNQYRIFDNELKRRLQYVNKPITEDKDYDVAEDFMQRRDAQLIDLAMLLKNSKGIGRVPWKTVSASLLKKTWLIFGKYNKVNENDIDKIADQILTNIARLDACTGMMGHTPYDVRDELDENGITFTDKQWDDWMTTYFTAKDGSWLLSDYGLNPLKNIYSKIFNADTPEEKLYACDKALNVVHQRSDLAAMFVEGGSATLTQIANQGGYDAGRNYGDVNKEFRNEGLEDSWENNGKKVTLRQLLDITKDIPVQDIPIEKVASRSLHGNNPSEQDNIDKSNLQYPILVITNTDGTINQIIDGHHRIQKAIKLKMSTIKGKLIKFDDLPYDFKDVLGEGYGSGIPEQDRLHIKGHRWQIKSKDAPRLLSDYGLNPLKKDYKFSDDKKEKEIKESYADSARFGLGAIGSNDDVQFKEFSRDVFGNQIHGRSGNPYGRRRFRYMGGVVEWSDCVRPDEDQKMLVDNYLERRGFPVKKHTSIYDEGHEDYMTNELTLENSIHNSTKKLIADTLDVFFKKT